MSAIPYDATRASLLNPQTKPTVFVPGRAVELRALCVEAARLAYVRAEEGGAALEELSDALAIVGFDPPSIFSDATTGSQGYGAFRRSDSLALLAFRGTEPDSIADIAIDLQVSLTEWTESGGRVHVGFARAARSMLSCVTNWLATTAASRAKVVMTGHSLGAAIASLLASACKADQLLTIGCPRVGDAAFKKTLDAVEITRLVDCCDIVTELPPEIGGYVHCAPMTYITSAGIVDSGAGEAFIESDRAAARRAYMYDYAWREGNVIIRDLADHAPINYVRAVFS
ncbi:hypothetical protein BSFA1_57930 [Burkholderia sp. SFA1]|nr:hypothetical protein BSFA1_57930 [Burkholderia sp. SFA1]